MPCNLLLCESKFALVLRMVSTHSLEILVSVYEKMIKVQFTDQDSSET